MLAEIVLSAGTDRITISTIPALFADAIHPALNEVAEREITELKKYPLTKKKKREWCGPGEGIAFPVQLKESDIDALHDGVWRDLPRFSIPILETAWEPYRAAFEKNPPIDWRLEVTHINPNTQHDWAWVTTETEYRKAIQQACIAGTLVPHDPVTLMPAPNAMGEYLKSCFITVEALRHFAEKSKVFVTVVDTNVTQAAPVIPESACDGVEPDKIKHKGNSYADRLEQALGRLEADKKAAADMATISKPELEKLATLNQKLEALPQIERRRLLDAMGLKHVSASPAPITPLNGLGYVPITELPKPVTQTATKFAPLPVVAVLAQESVLVAKRKRNGLSPVIELAQSKCRDPGDTAEVWAELQVLAERRQAPLIGATEDGLQYLKGGNAEIFIRDSLQKRLTREHRKLLQTTVERR